MSSSIENLRSAAVPHVHRQSWPRLVRTRALLARVGFIAGGIVIYLIATVSCLALGWLLPGRGIGTLAARLVFGCTLPAIGAVLLQQRLHRHRLAPLAAALFFGMMLVGLACIVGAIGMVVGFRILEQ